MGAEEKEKSIFIPIEIWTIKNLTLNEKIVLSDMLNQENKFKENYKGYNKKAETLKIEFNISDATELFKVLRKKKYIYANSDYYRADGKIKRGLPNRKINKTTLENAERFIISEGNMFLSAGEEGLLLTYKEVKQLNSWTRTGKEKELHHKTRTKFLILIILIRKKGFYLGKLDGSSFLYVRYSVQELAEYMGITRMTAGGYLKELRELQSYRVKGETKRIRILYDMSDLERYEELYDRYGNILTPYDEKENIKTITILNEEWEEIELDICNTNGLYFVDDEALEEINFYIDTAEKQDKHFQEIYKIQDEEWERLKQKWGELKKSNSDSIENYDQV